jgi:hypothetical protein
VLKNNEKKPPHFGGVDGAARSPADAHELKPTERDQPSSRRPRFARRAENIFSALSGRGQVVESGRSAIEGLLPMSHDGCVMTDYFHAKAYRNGNLHLRFRSLELLERFNMMAGGRRLSGAREGD